MFRITILRAPALLLRASIIRSHHYHHRLPQQIAVLLAHRYSSSSSSSTTVTTDGVVIPKLVAELSMSDYHKYANETLEGMIEDLEELMDTRDDCRDLDSELSNGILTLSVPNIGDYVINKQPPNKQIWFSSPVSGPNRFDLIDGEWVSLRDKTKLLEILGKEVGQGLGFEFAFNNTKR